MSGPCINNYHHKTSLKIIITKCNRLCYYKVRWAVIRKCDKCYYEVRYYKEQRLLQTGAPNVNFRKISVRETI